VYLQGVLSVEERLRQVREALRAEKDAHTRTREAHARTREAHEQTRQELEESKRLVEGFSGWTTTLLPDMNIDALSARVPASPAGPSSPNLPSSPTVPRTETVAVESTDTETPEPSVSVRGCMSPAEDMSNVDSGSPIAWRVRNEPRTRHPSLLQISPYVNPVTKVYKSRKRETAHPVTDAPVAQTMEGDRGGERIQVRNWCY